jgi:hypothetical protein
VGTRSTHQPRQRAQHGRATRNANQHAHDFESARPLIFGGKTPRRQPCSATRHVGRKSAKELLSLVPFSRVLFCHPCKFAHRPNCHGTDGQARLYPGTRGLPGLWLASIGIIKSFIYFLFFQKVWKPTTGVRQELPKFSRPQCLVGLKKQKGNR